MDKNLNKQDLDVILDSLTKSRDKILEGENFPTYQDKMERAQIVENVLIKVRKLKNDWID